MQQTNKYKLNLIEMSDTFALDPLNENAQKLEAALAALDGADAAEAEAREALDTRLAVLEAHKIAIGTYSGYQSKNRTIDVGFTPKVVLISSVSYGEVTLVSEGRPCTSDGTKYVEIVENGFALGDGVTFSRSNRSYNYFAFA